MGKLKDKVVIITGGAGGIGSGMAKEMAKEEAIVVIVDLNEDTGKAMEKELQAISPKSMFLQANLMDRENLGQIIKTVVDKYGKLDVLVNNAHASKQKTIEETTQEDLDLSFGTGFYPTFYLMQAALPYLLLILLQVRVWVAMQHKEHMQQQKKQFAVYPVLQQMNGDHMALM